MVNGTIRISIALLLVATALVSCKKDEAAPNHSGNPTNGITKAVFNPNVTYGTMTDQEGNIYKTVTIGTQTWMAENLRTTKYNDGTTIPHVTGNTEWNNLTTGAYCNLNNTTDNVYIATFGRLYNWHAVNTGKLAPTGWHVPTDAEWETLMTFLGGWTVAGGKMKEAGTLHWLSPNTGATNESGFTGLPGASRTQAGFEQTIAFGTWWSSTLNLNSGLGWAFERYLYYGHAELNRLDNPKITGFSVRCVKN